MISIKNKQMTEKRSIRFTVRIDSRENTQKQFMKTSNGINYDVEKILLLQNEKNPQKLMLLWT